MADNSKKDDNPQTGVQPELSEKDIKQLLETARQNVKQMAKRALEGETISSDLLKTRLKAL